VKYKREGEQNLLIRETKPISGKIIPNRIGGEFHQLKSLKDNPTDASLFAE